MIDDEPPPSEWAYDWSAEFGESPVGPTAVATVEPSPLFVDVAALLAGGLPEPPAPVLLRRTDGQALFYAGKVNILYGDPECGKTWIALAAVVEALNEGRRCAIIDMDHNGAVEIVGRLLLLGARPVDLSNPDLFHLAEPDDAGRLIAQVQVLRAWRPAVAVVDSLGEMLPLLELNSNSPDDYTKAHRLVLSPLADVGAAVIGIDHMPKSEDARAHGQTGTMAKKRAVNGVTLRVTIHEQFAQGRGGAASLHIHKDRPGGLRGNCPPDKKWQMAGRFVMTAIGDGVVSWKVTTPPKGGDGAEAVEDPKWLVVQELVRLADELGCKPDAGRRAIQDAMRSQYPNLKHGTDTWNSSFAVSHEPAPDLAVWAPLGRPVQGQVRVTPSGRADGLAGGAVEGPHLWPDGVQRASGQK